MSSIEIKKNNCKLTTNNVPILVVFLLNRQMIIKLAVEFSYQFLKRFVTYRHCYQAEILDKNTTNPPPPHI